MKTLSNVFAGSVPVCAEARDGSSHDEVNVVANRETNPTKAREITHRLGIAEPRIGFLLKMPEFWAIFTDLFCTERCAEAQLLLCVSYYARASDR
jgi:hypothetical protein